MLYGSETWCLNEKRSRYLEKNGKSNFETHVGVKLIDRKNTKDLMNMLGLTASIKMTANAL